MFSGWAHGVGAKDGVDVVVISPGPGTTVVSGPVVVTMDISLGEGPAPDRVRENIDAWRLCYAVDGDRPPFSEPLNPDPNKGWSGLPILDDGRMEPGTQHKFEAWLEQGTCGAAQLSSAEVVGFTEHIFNVRRKVSAHHARLEKWESEVSTLKTKGKRPVYIEIGTSFFETLAHEHAEISNDPWLGTSVEPFVKYLDQLQTRAGLR